MDMRRPAALTSVKRSALRSPFALVAGGAALIALLGLNAVAFAAGIDAPWMLGTVILADMLVIGAGVLVAAREVLMAEGRSEASEARLAAIVDSAMDAIITVDEEQKIVLFNRAAEVAFGCPRSEAIGAPLEGFIPQRFRAAHRGHIEHFGRTGVTSRKMGDVATLWALRAGGENAGEEFPIEASISQAAEGDRRLFTVILRDITERQRLENRLRQSERNLAEGQRLTRTGSWVLDFRTGNTDWSVETCRIFGFPDHPPSPHYSEFQTRMHPDNREDVDRKLRENFETNKPRPLEYLFVLPDRTNKYIETISQPIRDESRSVVRLMKR